jgi:hypothetical protein
MTRDYASSEFHLDKGEVFLKCTCGYTGNAITELEYDSEGFAEIVRHECPDCQRCWSTKVYADPERRPVCPRKG